MVGLYVKTELPYMECNTREDKTKKQRNTKAGVTDDVKEGGLYEGIQINIWNK